MAQGTKLALAASLGKLLKRKPLDDITVKEIVEDCAVNRQTFYYHFQDIYDLLRWYLDYQTDAVLSKCSSWQEALLNAFLFTRENHVAIYHIFHSTGREHMDCHFYALAYKITSRVFSAACEGLPLTAEDQEFLSDFYMYALAGMLIGWVAGGMKEEPADLVVQVSRLLDGDFCRIAKKFAGLPPDAEHPRA